MPKDNTSKPGTDVQIIAGFYNTLPFMGFILNVSAYSDETCHGLILGGGIVYPELNFTLPPITICKETLPEIREHYRSIIDEALIRAHELGQKGVVFEFETLLEIRKN